MKPPEEFKRDLLAHCLLMADMDPEYAVWSAGQHEAAMPWLLANLERKVRQHIARSGVTLGKPLPTWKPEDPDKVFTIPPGYRRPPGGWKEAANAIDRN